MKLMTLLLVLLSTAVIAQKSSNTEVQFSKARLQASGLTCALCSKAINTSLEQLPFVSSVKADIKTSSFHIEFKPGQKVDIDALKNGVEDAGFSVAKLTLTGNFKPVEIEQDTHSTFDGTTFHFLSVKKQVLEGEKQLTVVDKNFLPAKEFKKYLKSSTYACVETGKAASCCHKEGSSSTGRIYHVTI